jgi:hypothetical protein
MFEKYEELDNTLPEISLEDIRYRLKYIPRGKFGFVRMMLHEAFGRWKKVIQHV